MRLRTAVALWLAFVVIGFGASPAGAVSFTLEVLQNGVSQGDFNEAELGCSSSGGPSETCYDSWNITVDPDAVVHDTVAVNHVSAADRQFTLALLAAGLGGLWRQGSPRRSA